MKNWKCWFGFHSWEVWSWVGELVCIRCGKVREAMKVIRQICYEGTEEALRKQLAMSMPDGVRVHAVTLDVRTVYSELPELKPFVETEELYLLSGAEAKAFIKAMKGEDV